MKKEEDKTSTLEGKEIWQDGTWEDIMEESTKELAMGTRGMDYGEIRKIPLETKPLVKVYD